MLSEGVDNPLLRNTSKEVPFIRKGEKNEWIIISGNWSVNQPLILYGDLIVEKGTILDFNTNAFLIIVGSLKIKGTNDEKVIFKSTTDSWKGVYLLSDNMQKSTIENFVLRKTSETDTGILNLTGGFTIYDSDILMNNVAIESSIAEDAINIVNSKVNINNLSIKNSISDGLDCDFCSGTIKNSNVSFIDGDGMDFSGSNIELYQIIANNIKDKAVSVGEKSNALIKDSYFNEVGVGVASKDASSTEMHNVAIENYKLFAAMTYQKKKIFEKRSELRVFASNVKGPQPYMRQKGTFLNVNNVEIKETEINVDEMYEQGIMKK